MLNLMWWYAIKNKHLVEKNMKLVEIKQLRIRFMIASVAILLAVRLSFISPYIGIVMYFLLTIWAIVEILISEPDRSSNKV